MSQVVDLKIGQISPYKLKPWTGSGDDENFLLQPVPIDRRSPSPEMEVFEASPIKLFHKSPVREQDLSSFCEEGNSQIANAMYENLMRLRDY